jgi:Fur family iron response transcriptional regulator
MNELHLSRTAISDLLRRHGITPTHQRIEIAYVLFSRQQHLSADQVLAMVNAHQPETSKATVYNTLKLFVRKGLVREVIADPNRVFYDSNTSEHHHLYDVVNGTLTDIDASTVRIEGLPELPEDVVTEGIDVIVRIRPRAAS